MNLMRQASDMLFFLATSISKTLHQKGSPYAYFGIYVHSILLNDIYNKRDYKWLRFTQAKLINMKERDRETICVYSKYGCYVTKSRKLFKQL